jgi:hypothetical protein
MRIVIRPIGWYSSEFEYYTTIVSPLIQRLSKVFGDKVRINSGSLQSSSSSYPSPSSLDAATTNKNTTSSNWTYLPDDVNI